MALGKGLNSLIGDQTATSKRKRVRKETSINSQGERVFMLSVDEVHPNRSQPRTQFDPKELDDLVTSIKKHGVLQPIVVTEAEEGYELIAGERRTRASKLAGKTEIPAIVRSVTDQERLELALIENIQRHDLNAIEEARAYRQLMDEFDLTQQEVSDQVGKSRSAVANTVRLLELPEDIQDALQQGTISAGKARALLGLKSTEEQQDMFQSMIGEKMSVRDVEAAVQLSPSKKGSKRRDPNINAIERELETSLGTKVRIQESNGKGKITIEFYSKEELQEIIKRCSA